VGSLYQDSGPSYPPGTKRPITLVFAEALSWLTTQGLIVNDPDQPAFWYRLTRRAADLRTRADVEAFRKRRILPDDLVPALFARKVVPLFRRGDYDVAVHQAFKEVEVTVRKAANAKGAGYPDSDVGTTLMRNAFHPQIGPLTDMTIVPAEREAVMHLFSGAIGHAKNPPSHRDVAITAQEAARLIIFASHLLDIVEQRAEKPFSSVGVSMIIRDPK
ncbi:MAG: TIGR02391 family protein, partial [Methylocella sp.]